MKKRCTNSKCRKFFSVKDTTLRCPYCGKEYYRLHNTGSKTYRSIPDCYNSDNNRNIEKVSDVGSQRTWLKNIKGIHLIDYKTEDRIPVIRAVKELTGLGLRETMELVESVPVFMDMKELVYDNLHSNIEDQDSEGADPLITSIAEFLRKMEELGCVYKTVS